MGAGADRTPEDADGTDSSPTDSSPTDSSPTDSSPTDSSPTDSSPTDSGRRGSDLKGAGAQNRKLWLGYFAIGFVSTLLVAIGGNPPTTPLLWVGVVTGAALTAWLIAEGVLPRTGLRTAEASDRKKRHPWRLALAVVTALAAGFGIPPLVSYLATKQYYLTGCPVPTELTVLSSPGGLEPTRELVAGFERWTAQRNFGCATVNTYVYAAPDARVREAVRGGQWQGGPDQLNLSDPGPRPDAWLPDSAVEVDRIGSAVAQSGVVNPVVPDSAGFTIASSPLVLGVPEYLPSVDLVSSAASWATVVDRVIRSNRPMVRPDPQVSAAGAVSTALLYGHDLDGDGPWTQGQPLTGPQAIEQRIAGSLAQGGYPASGGELELLCHHRQLDKPPSVVIASEQMLSRFDTGRPLGGQCGATDFSRPNQLRPFYPTDTPNLRRQLVRFRWSGPAQRERAAQLREWLASPDGHRALRDVGLRPPSNDVAPRIAAPVLDDTVREYLQAAR